MGKIVGVSVNRDVCLHHGCCWDVCPEVFAAPGETEGNEALVRPGAAAFFRSHDLKIRETVAGCPMAAIRIEER